MYINMSNILSITCRILPGQHDEVQGEVLGLSGRAAGTFQWPSGNQKQKRVGN